MSGPARRARIRQQAADDMEQIGRPDLAEVFREDAARLTDSPLLRIRFYVAGALADETWLDVSAPDHEARADEVTDRHLKLAERSTTLGHRWMLEMYDPGLPQGRRYLRIGTDRAGMICGHTVTSASQLTDEIDRRYAVTTEVPYDAP